MHWRLCWHELAFASLGISAVMVAGKVCFIVETFLLYEFHKTMKKSSGYRNINVS